MSKEDKQFFTDLITNLKISIQDGMTDLKTGLQGEMADMKTGLQDEMADMKTSLQGEMADMKTDLGSQIRHNGVLIEDMQSDIKLLCESHETMRGQLKKVTKDVEEIKENISDLPIIRQTVTSHSVALLELSK